ncbi:MAG: hypothetical protein M3376_13720 [Actinomycetota bacterium]|nr:hypothetical protein [Actinomycetota bacterium]
MVIALVVAFLTDTSVGGVALGLVVTFPIAQLAFAVWLRRRDEFAPAPRS